MGVSSLLVCTPPLTESFICDVAEFPEILLPLFNYSMGEFSEFPLLLGLSIIIFRLIKFNLIPAGLILLL